MAKGKKGFQPGNSYGRRFSATKQPLKRGRKRSLYKQINLPGEELSREDFTHLMRSLLECSPAQLEKIRQDCQQKDSKIPVWVANLITAIYRDIKKGRIDCLRWVLDRSFGKTNRINLGNNQINLVKNDIQVFNFSVLSDAELTLFHTLCLKMEGKIPVSVPIDPEKIVPG